MTPEELCDAGIALYGQWGWQKALAVDLSVDYATVKRWVNGSVSVTGPAAKAVRLMLYARELEAQLAKQRRKAPKRLPRRGRMT